MVTQLEYPVTPTTERIRGTLFDVAPPGPEFPWHDGLDLFESYNCMTFRERAEFCAPGTKDFDQAPGWESGVIFAAYGGMTCKPIGFDLDHTKAEMTRAFEAGEHIAVEQALMELRFIENDPDGVGGDDPLWTAPEDITPASGAVSPAVGIALLEGHSAGHYVGVPTLHLPRSVASLQLATDAMAFEGTQLRTQLGSKVAAGGGYDMNNTGPTGDPAATGERWLYATGEVMIRRSQTIVKDALDAPENDYVVVVERMYLAAVDCYSAAIRVTLED